MLILKLTIVPLALLVFGIVERLHGPRVAGWLSGFPIVGGPLLLFVTLDHGSAFGSQAALGAYFGLVPWLAFTMSYAFCSRSLGWLWCSLIGFALWTAVAVAAVAWQGASPWLELLPFAAFIAALFVYPRGEPSDEEREHVWWGLPARMIAGAALTLVITQFAGMMGSKWSGLFSTFPVMGSIICISSQLQYGRHAVQEAVAGMSMGLASVGTFCFVLYILLSMMGVWPAFGLSLVASSSAHALTWLLFKNPKR
ncbi:MAG TPA: hypothetical protein VFI23_06060 [Rhizomicrobium sp.]|nr:hypothetical protein [Rhizomicrobium sp.]